MIFFPYLTSANIQDDKGWSLLPQYEAPSQNKNMHIVLNESRSPIPQVEGKKKQYTAHYVKRYDCERQFQHINIQPINWVLHAVDNNIMQNLPILQVDVGMAEDIYGPSVPNFQGKTV